jgi:RNA recognition motif-containing protein
MGKELYVRHISDRATETDLWKLFGVAGTVSSVHLVTDPETGQFKGCAFVRMASERETKEAIDTLDGALLINRVIEVSEARPQKPKGRAFGGGQGKPGPAARSGRGRK